jgi:hypothetical protein
MEEILASIRQIISEDGEGADKAAAGQAAPSGGAAASSQGGKTAASSTPDMDKADTNKADAGKADAGKADAGKADAGKADTDGDDAGSMANDEPEMDARAEAELAKAEDAFSSDDGDGAASSDDDTGGDDSGAFDDPAENAADVFATEPDSDAEVEESTSMAMPAESKQQSPAPVSDDNLLSEDSDEVVHGAFSALAHTILAQNARTLEDLISEMLQPMLKGWLDDNLPSLVERLVKQEIDRVSRGRR